MPTSRNREREREREMRIKITSWRPQGKEQLSKGAVASPAVRDPSIGG